MNGYELIFAIVSIIVMCGSLIAITYLGLKDEDEKK